MHNHLSGISRVVTYPWDTVKTLAQSDSVVHMKKDRRNLSLSDLFRGLGPTILAAMPANAVFFIGNIRPLISFN